MVKVLIGDRNIQKDIDNFRFLNDNNEYQVITSTSGLETIARCREIEPSIIILDSNFDDMIYTDIIDKISLLPNELNKCNLILKVNRPEDKMLLSNTSIVYKIFDNTINENDTQKAVNILKHKFDTPDITIKELKSILLSLGIYIYSNASQYLISAIFKCYYTPEHFVTLDRLYEVIADEYNVSKEQIKNSIRHLIDTFNKSYNLKDNDLYYKIFMNKTNISPKQFIQIFVNYLHDVKGQN